MIDDPRGADETVRDAVLAATGRDVVLVVEYVTYSRNSVTVARLAEARAKWETCGQLRGLRVVRVTPQRWQGAILGRVAAGTTKAVAQQCARAILLRERVQEPEAEGEEALARPSDDEADAICLGAYAARMGAALAAPAGRRRRRR